MSGAILGIERLLRPAWNFELDYDGEDGSNPILFTWPPAKTRPALGAADYSVLDELAQLSPVPTGVSPVLAKFVEVPAGSSMLIFYPVVTCKVSELARFAYVWRIVWRTRSAADYTKPERRKSYQIGKTSLGAADSRTLNVPDPRGITVGGTRYVLPGASEAVIYGHGEPKPFDMISSPSSGTFFHDAVSIPATFKMLTASPIIPGSNLYPVGVPDTYVRRMDYQQGVFDPDFPGLTGVDTWDTAFNPVTVTHLPKWIKSHGTEFALEVYKFEYDDPNNYQSYTQRAWDFTVVANLPTSAGEDYLFSCMFGIGALSAGKSPPEDTGVRVMVGTAPA